MKGDGINKLKHSRLRFGCTKIKEVKNIIRRDKNENNFNMFD